MFLAHNLGSEFAVGDGAWRDREGRLGSAMALCVVGARRFSESITEALKGKIRVMTIFPAMVVTELTTCAAAVGMQSCAMHACA